MQRIIRIGTRSSQLALWQAEHVARLLAEKGWPTEIVHIDTKGDQILDREIAKIGSKGIFTEELEDQLRNGHIDIAVHSAKDMPSSLDPSLAIIAFTEREQVHDVVISLQPDFSLASGKPYRLGTSSVRRVAFFKHYYPHLEIAPVRGNLQTRMRKLEEGPYDALVLAWAGVYRMGLEQHVAESLPANIFVPAVGQGSIAIEAALSLNPAIQTAIREAVNHLPSETCLLAERAFLKTLEGGCSIPAFALATLPDPVTVSITGGIIDTHGDRLVKLTKSAPITDAAKIGHELAEHVLREGGKEILAAIKGH